MTGSIDNWSKRRQNQIQDKFVATKTDIRKPQQEAEIQKAKSFYQELMDQNVFERIATFAKISNFVSTHQESLSIKQSTEYFNDPELNKELRELRNSLFEEYFHFHSG